MSRQLIDLSGQRFGEWKVLAKGQYLLSSGSKRVTWTCRCSCGMVHDVLSASLRDGTSTRCVDCAKQRRR